MAHQDKFHSEARDRVLNASYGLFLQNGLTAVSMQQIAEDAGITKATLYHHFRDKHDLYLSTMRLAISKNEHALTQNLEGCTSLRELVHELISYVFGDDRADLQRLAMDFRLHVDNDAQEQFWEQFQLPWRLVQSAIENIDGISEAQAIHISRYVYGAATGLSQLYRFEEDSHPITDDVLETLTETILFGLTPEQPPQ